MTINVELFICLLIIFQVKHFIADFVLQNVWMLQKSRPGWDFVAPLSIHCGVHAGITLVVALYVNPQYWWLAVADFVIHFTMDRIKEVSSSHHATPPSGVEITKKPLHPRIYLQPPSQNVY